MRKFVVTHDHFHDGKARHRGDRLDEATDEQMHFNQVVAIEVPDEPVNKDKPPTDQDAPKKDKSAK